MNKASQVVKAKTWLAMDKETERMKWLEHWNKKNGKYLIER